MVLLWPTSTPPRVPTGSTITPGSPVLCGGVIYTRVATMLLDAILLLVLPRPMAVTHGISAPFKRGVYGLRRAFTRHF